MRKKIKIASIAVIIVAAGVGTFVGAKVYNVNQNYNKYLNQANEYMSSEKYDNAIISYQEASKYKEDINNSKIELAKILRSSKVSYDTAVKQMNNKQYSEAIETFKRVDKQDTKRYEIAESKISECNAEILKQKAEQTKAAAEENAKKNAEEKAKTTQNNPITQEQAIQLVKQIVKKNVIYAIDHDEVVDGIECYVVHAYEMVDDGYGAGHTATAGWYSVQKNNGKIYDNLLDTEHLHPLN